MNPPEFKKSDTTKINISRDPAYSDTYANSVQVRMSVWDFQLVFGTMHQDTPEEMTFHSLKGIYLSPQQAKALFNVLGQNLAQYEQTFGPLALEPQFIPPSGPVH